MEIREILIAWAFLFMFALPGVAEHASVLSTREIISRVRESLVVITTEDRQGNAVAEGSGFFIAPKIVVTDLHVLKRASRGYVKLAESGETYKITKVAAFSLKKDICELYLADAKGTPLPSSSSVAEVGQEILVAGNPEGLESTFSKGIVSAIRANAGLIQIDAPISPGSSGGPVVNQRGEVVAVVESTLTEGQNLNFAVPIRYAGGHLVGRIAEGSMSIDTAGRIAVTDREYLGFHNNVETVEQSEAAYSYDSSRDQYVIGPALPNGDKLIFNQDGRLQKEDGFLYGKCAGTFIYEYQEDGLELSRTYVGCDGMRQTTDLSVSDAVDVMAARIHLCESQDSGPASGIYHTVTKYDCRGLEVEISRPARGYKSVMEYDDQGRETENLEYQDGKLTKVTRSTYETNTHGDWIKRHETEWDAKWPALGFTPSREEYRKITYYVDED